MKTSHILAIGFAAVLALGWNFTGGRADAQTPARAAAGTPPVGKLVEIRLVAWPLATAEAGKVTGTLLTMTDQWIIVQDGSYEQWIPREKVMSLKASR